MRSRNIKPGFFKNEILGECSPLTRILFAGIWCMADREGRLEDRPKRIKVEIVPYDDIDVDEALNCLHENGFIIRYSVQNQRYIQIANWKKHQTPHMKEAPSVIPELVEHKSSTVQAPCETDIGTSAAHLIPDSLLLIPDSNKTTLSGKPDEEAGKDEKIPSSTIQEIVEYLNEAADKDFRWQSKPTQIMIKARLKEGFEVEDFKLVIDHKVKNWKHSVSSDGRPMYGFLRPQTLFGTKFEAYLNEIPITK
ncbi:MAG TPA: hypothetical protein DCZ95_18030 [Verrucomicrobia bacterium]|nr:hypothetical protein [Verrucomicrobiota bacterium]